MNSSYFCVQYYLFFSIRYGFKYLFYQESCDFQIQILLGRCESKHLLWDSFITMVTKMVLIVIMITLKIMIASTVNNFADNIVITRENISL